MECLRYGLGPQIHGPLQSCVILFLPSSRDPAADPDRSLGHFNNVEAIAIRITARSMRKKGESSRRIAVSRCMGTDDLPETPPSACTSVYLVLSDNICLPYFVMQSLPILVDEHHYS